MRFKKICTTSEAKHINRYIHGRMSIVPQRTGHPRSPKYSAKRDLDLNPPLEVTNQSDSESEKISSTHPGIMRDTLYRRSILSICTQKPTRTSSHRVTRTPPRRRSRTQTRECEMHRVRTIHQTHRSAQSVLTFSLKEIPT